MFYGSEGKMSADRGKKKRYRKLRRKIKFHLFFQLLAIGAILCVQNRDTIKYYTDTVKGLYEEAEDIAAGMSEDDFRRSLFSTAYAADGTVLSVWKDDKSGVYVPLEEMPQIVKDAMICMEDKRFEKHHGVDCKALFRAAAALAKNRGEVTQGGSTITMQLVRSKYLTPEVSWQRKLKEIFIARRMEEKFSKEQILEFYLNNIYFGNGYYGIGSAAEGYFGKDVRELSTAQLIYLCAIPNNPTRYDPLVNGENTRNREYLILEQMEKDGYLSAEERTAAQKVLVEPEKAEGKARNDYLETYAAYCTVRTLMELSGFTFQYEFSSETARRAYEEEYDVRYENCRKLLYTEGYRVETSLDPAMQRSLQEAVDKELVGFGEVNGEGVYTLQGAAVCIDNQTGYVKAIVGGRSQEQDSYSLNRGYQSFRQPGSAIKPLIVYTPMFERGYMPEMTVEDEPIPGGPQNVTGSYEGTVTIRHAVEESINTVAWKLFEELTPENGVPYLTEMEFSKIRPMDYDLPTALGGFTVGVSTLEMASAYAAIENEGVYRSPSCVMRITDADGSVIYEADRTGKTVYMAQAAETMEDVLTGVMENGTGAPVKLAGKFCAGKTGTTNDYKDSWFVGYTEEYTTAVWVGYDRPKPMEGISGPSYSGYIWKNFMERL